MQSERQPLYVQIQEHFKQLISSGKLADGDRIPSEKELIARFNVSRITVANALAQLAKDGWIYRIPGRGSFVGRGEGASISPQAGGIQAEKGVQDTAAGVRKMIGLLIPSMADYFALRLVQGIVNELNDTGYYLATVLTHNSKEREREAIVELTRMGAAGLIIFPVDAETYNEEILALKMNKFPFVLIDRYLPGVETNFVCSDSALGAKLAVSHLWELGHRKIAICSDSPLPTVSVDERIAGYMEALKEQGAMIDPSLILTDFRIDDVLLDEHHPLYRHLQSQSATAYIALNAKLGIHIAILARRLGLRVPDDLSILTFDDPSPGLEEPGRYTHVAQSEGEIGSKAAEILIRLLEHPQDKEKDNGQYTKIILRPELVVRGSTGPVKPT
ncbi:GntR family transcriptional regulator [Paenibacillus oleatilyticus]|uniref:GntR family transcriptional regulator n=1 Tax=Paenibacillus oleatilyticus TaxID=2594886 RepID=UPI001C1F8208|nr:GntR family transcriptional regulator [Paenibacillus oleatilyticus]MBU7314069.1 GntR family transcriptional regulator [Paenibacillus oleatilyticus]